MKNFILLLFVLLAFAGNSVLNRLALKGGHIDAESFTIIRLSSGAILLALLVLLYSGLAKFTRKELTSDFSGAFSLFLYAITFSVAYLTLDAGTGALILFGVVQVVLLVLNFKQGNRLIGVEWLGLTLAIAGLFVLLLPGATAPDPVGFLLMAIAGGSWAVYTFLGRGSQDATYLTALNFIKSLLFCIPLLAWTIWFETEYQLPSRYGVFLALMSGAVTSAMGYAIWYRLLRDISIFQAAVFQLLVPVVAAVAGVILLGEPFTLILVIASVLILGGILLIQSPKFKVDKS